MRPTCGVNRRNVQRLPVVDIDKFPSLFVPFPTIPRSVSAAPDLSSDLPSPASWRFLCVHLCFPLYIAETPIHRRHAVQRGVLQAVSWRRKKQDTGPYGQYLMACPSISLRNAPRTTFQREKENTAHIAPGGQGHRA